MQEDKSTLQWKFALCSNSSDSNAEQSVNENNAASNISQFASLYKTPNISKCSQEERRKIFLEQMKEKRNAAFDDKRDISEVFKNNTSDEAMNVDDVKTKKKRNRKFNNKLTFSEWFYEIPDDLEEDWLVKFCPFGVRNLVVANLQTTKSFSRSGRFESKFVSALPGGGPSNSGNRFTILDCIYDRNLSRYYVLDAIAWNSTDIRHCETEFRFYWLKSKFEEFPQLNNVAVNNEHSFYLIDSLPAKLSLIESELHKTVSIDDGATVDGVLFYHKKSHYVSGYTPLVTWLKPYMLPEILNIQVNPLYEQEKPPDYTTLPNYLKKIKRLKKILENQKSEEETVMETETPS